MPILQPGTYAFQNPLNYASHTYILSADGFAEVYTAEVAHYPAQLLKVIPAAELAALIAALPAWSAAEFTPAPVPTIGKPRAHQLHIIMAKVGIPSGEHYAFARAATDDHDIYSLAALTGEQADAVWAYLCFCYPKAANMSVAA